MTTDHEWLDSAAAYALGSLDPEEAAAFEAHLAECALCQREVESMREVAGLVAHSAPRRAPPPALRDRILRDAHKVRPIGAATTSRPPAAEAPATPVTPAPVVPSSPTVTSAAPPPLPRRWRATPWLAAAACLVLALAGLSLYLNEREARAAAEQRMADADARLGDAQRSLAERDSLLAVVLAPDVRTTQLSSSGRAPSLRLYWSRPSGNIVLAAYNLPPARAGRTYQLWGIVKGEAPVSLGTFDTGANGRAVVALRTRSGATYDVSAVTDEPAGGSPQPTTTPFLVGSWGAAP